MQAYSDPTYETELDTPPDVEVFHVPTDSPLIEGWYWWHPRVPDSDPVGPFDTEAEALADAQNTTN